MAVLASAGTLWLAVGAAYADTAPTNDTPPSISGLPQSGIPQQGDTLTADPGAWSGDPTPTLTYAWSDGTTTSTDVLSSADVGQSVSVTVTATNDAGQMSLTTASVGPVVPPAPVADPSNPPTISGSPQQGDTLTVTNNGAWQNGPTFTYVWEDCDSTATVCAPISGAGSSSYTLQSTDVGSTIVAVVFGSNSGGQSSATSNSLGPVKPPAPVADPSNPPTISGTAQQGDTLTVTNNGSWENDPAYTYAWEDCNGGSCAPITGAGSSSYTLQSTDVGDTVMAVVTGTNLGGNSSATSNGLGPVKPLAPVADSSNPPTISGGTVLGDTLSVTNNGTWENDPTGFTYAWEDCNGGSCATITGAGSSSYTLQSTDLGDTVVAVVTGTNLGGNSSAASNGIGPVVPPAPVADSSNPPTISGGEVLGDTLTVTNNGTWENGPTFTYAWEDCSGGSCATISGAGSSSYTLQSTDLGDTVVAVVTGTNAGGHSSATSNSLGPVVPPAPLDTTAPGIGGTPQQGDTLTANPGVWSNSPTFTYAWDDCGASGDNCSPIASASAKSKTYKPVAADVGQMVSVTVTATNAGGHNAVTSQSVGPVLPPAPVNTSAPQVTGTAEQGDTLSVSNPGAWNNGPTTYTYAWEECNGSGANCSAIPGATSSSYTLSAADIGSTIVCVVTANGPGGETPANSNTTKTVVAAPTPAASEPTTTSLLASPGAAVTNQGVTLIATVTSTSSASTALWGSVTFEDGGGAINGCVGMPVTPSGQSATVACSTSFAASAAQLTAVFTPIAGSVLMGSVSPVDALAVSADTTATSIDATASVSVGSSTTFTASVAPPAARLGPIEPTGSVEFLDGGQPIASCAGQTLSGGQATCTVTYTAAGAHQISARYLGDANFTGSSSPAESVSAAPLSTGVQGTITSTMLWAFYYTPSYTQVRALVVNGTLPGATVLVKCHGKGCPFASHSTLLGKRARCGKKTKGMCAASGSFLVTPGFANRHLGVGARITIEIVRPSWVGKFYSFTVRSRQGPRIHIGCLAPGAGVPGQGC